MKNVIISKIEIKKFNFFIQFNSFFLIEINFLTNEKLNFILW